MKVLLIAKQYPPDRSARALQAERMVDTLRRHGWTFEILAGLNRSQRHGDPLRESVHYVPFDRPEGDRSMLARVRRVAGEFVEVLGFDRWNHEAAQRGAALIESTRPDVILSQSVPFGSHRVASALARRCPELPWIAFFSDPWPLGPLPPPYNQKQIRALSKLQAREVRRVLAPCRVIAAPTCEVADYVAGHAGLDGRVPIFETLHFGADFAPASAISHEIRHVGHLTSERVTPQLVQGVVDAATRLHAQGGSIAFVGDTDPAFTHAVSARTPVGSVRFEQRVSPGRARELVASARALLLVEADTAFSPYLPSKAVDYVLSGRPAVMVTPRGSALRRITKGMNAVTVCTHDSDTLSAALFQAWTRKERAEQIASASESAFSNEVIISRYERLVDEALKR